MGERLRDTLSYENLHKLHEKSWAGQLQMFGVYTERSFTTANKSKMVVVE